MNPRFWRIALLGNRPHPSLARKPSDGFSVPGPSSHSQHIRPSKLSLFPSHLPVLYFQLSQLPNSLFHPSARRSLPPLPTYTAAPIVNATPQPLAPSSSLTVPVTSLILTPFTLIRSLPLRLTHSRSPICRYSLAHSYAT